MFYEFRWIDWNLDKVAKHGLEPWDVEYVVDNARQPYPKPLSDGRWIVRGVTGGGRWLQVIYLIDADSALFVIHARPIDADESRRARRAYR